MFPPIPKLRKGNKINLYNRLVVVIKICNVESRKCTVFKHGTFPAINIVSSPICFHHGYLQAGAQT